MILILGACQPLGQTAAVFFAEKGARVVLIDSDPEGLEAICAHNPDWIEVLAIEDVETQMAPLLKSAWGGHRIDLVVNLMPLAQPADISGQMRTLSSILRTTLRGLVAGKGSLITVVSQPDDPLAFVAHGMKASVSAASTALGQALAGKGVRVHCVTVPAGDQAAALDLLTVLGGPAGNNLRSATLDLDKAAANRPRAD